MINKIKGGGVTTAMGFSASAVFADIKGNGKNRPDVGLLVSDAPCVTAALFTSNAVQAAPIKYDKEILKKNSDKIAAIIANSGNANACTGPEGLEACRLVSKAVAEAIHFREDSVLTASTGVIGTRLPYEKITGAAKELAENLSDDGGSDFAKAVMTTDTVPKEAALMVEIDSGNYILGGCCKGSGMIAPSLATMLAFITTDAVVPQYLLDRALKEAAAESFNLVTVDGDMSTNDSLFLLSNGMSGTVVDEKGYADFLLGLKTLCLTLAKFMAKDGEGATKLVTVKVRGAQNSDEAKLCAAKIANSPLVKTMFAGCDPNWGRLMASAGASGAKFDPDKTDIFFNDLHYVKNGVIIDPSLEKKAYAIMKEDEYEITLDLQSGGGEAVFYTCDFTTDYIKINADYRS